MVFLGSKATRGRAEKFFNRLQEYLKFIPGVDLRYSFKTYRAGRVIELASSGEVALAQIEAAGVMGGQEVVLHQPGSWMMLSACGSWSRASFSGKCEIGGFKVEDDEGDPCRSPRVESGLGEMRCRQRWEEE